MRTSNPASPPVVFRVCTRPEVPGAVAVVQVEGDLGSVWGPLGLAPMRVGEVSFRTLLGVDRGVAVRWSPTCLQLMPHGGLELVRVIRQKLQSAGLVETERSDAQSPESADPVEARMLATLARAASPLAVDLLLDQPRRWRDARDAPDMESRSNILNRLIEPPLVAAIGASNIGKSSLVNALAGRSVSVVADEPGTTRDHVGVRIDMSGLVVRYLDTPGIRTQADALERRAVDAAMLAAEEAELVLLCGDATARLVARADTRPERVLRVGLRSDLGPSLDPVDLRVCVRTGEGVGDLVRAIRQKLVPDQVLHHPGPWKFWAGPWLPER